MSDLTARLRALADAATLGPWQSDCVDAELSQWGVWADAGLLRYFFTVEPEDGFVEDFEPMRREDAEFIAAARNDLPAALDRIDELEAWATDLDALALARQAIIDTHVQTIGVQATRIAELEALVVKWEADSVKWMRKARELEAVIEDVREALTDTEASDE